MVKYYNPKGFVKRGTREPLSYSDKNVDLPVAEKNHNINWPVLGIIVDVKFADSERNRSRQALASRDEELNRTLSAEGLIKSLSSGSRTKGTQIECDVRVVDGLSRGNADQPILLGVPICNTFGGVEDYGMVIPRARRNTTNTGETGKGDGDYCLVQFIGGRYGSPIITHIFPHPLNSHDPQRVIDGKSAYFKYNGVQLFIDSKGNLTLDARDANQAVSVDPNSGVVNRRATLGTEGKITVATKNDVMIAAGTPGMPGQEAALPNGKATVTASKSVNIHSTKDNVNVQETYGNMRRAARQYDSVVVDGGELFEHLLALRTTHLFLYKNLQTVADNFEAATSGIDDLLSAVGSITEAVEKVTDAVDKLAPDGFSVPSIPSVPAPDPTARGKCSMALSMMAAVLEQFHTREVPSSGTGRITGGSGVCFIGNGKKTFPFDDVDNLAELQAECLAEAAANAAANIVATNANFAVAQSLIDYRDKFEDLILTQDPVTQSQLRFAYNTLVGLTAQGAEYADLATGVLSGDMGSILELADLVGVTDAVSSASSDVADFVSKVAGLSDSDEADEKAGSFGDLYSKYLECLNDKVNED
tara:strand:- start:7763 stop:9529 length:1767 start_codon:yes stop_codon:yes gene_type:complete